jgi:heptosyltransferase II
MQTFSANSLIQIPAKRWRKKYMPRRLLVIRLQAMGDLVITLPYLQNLRNTLPPGTELDLLTRVEVESIPKNLELFDHVYSIGGGRNWKKQLALTYLLLPKLLMRRYDAVIDLQNNIISKTVRKALMPEAWSEFDRFSPVPAGECTRLSIEAIGLGDCVAEPGFKIKTPDEKITALLKQNGWDGKNKLVVLNPAGAFKTRHWPIENYTEIARLWIQSFPQTQFVVMGTGFISAKANYFKRELDSKLINLVGKTTPVQAIALLQKIQLVISEDSGLMHMAWTSGIRTLAIFGSTRSVRATPLGEHTLLLNSSDLPCGNCMLEKCKFGDNHCMTRYSPQFVFEKACSLLSSRKIKALSNKLSSSINAEIITDKV